MITRYQNVSTGGNLFRMSEAIEGRILVVDDEPAIRTLLRFALAGTGFEVVEADCGQKALQVAGQTGPCSLVITDVLMPGMDGVQLAQELASAGYADKFLFISGYSNPEDSPERLEALPAAAFLMKPFAIPDLLRAVRSLLEQQPKSERDRSSRFGRSLSA
jgi:CheY-like chemotaxis protein